MILNQCVLLVLVLDQINELQNLLGNKLQNLLGNEHWRAVDIIIKQC